MQHAATRGVSPHGCKLSMADLAGVSKDFLIILRFAPGVDAGSSVDLRLEELRGVLEVEAPSSSSAL